MCVATRQVYKATNEVVEHTASVVPGFSGGAGANLSLIP